MPDALIDFLDEVPPRSVLNNEASDDLLVERREDIVNLRSIPSHQMLSNPAILQNGQGRGARKIRPQSSKIFASLRQNAMPLASEGRGLRNMATNGLNSGQRHKQNNFMSGVKSSKIMKDEGELMSSNTANSRALEKRSDPGYFVEQYQLAKGLAGKG